MENRPTSVTVIAWILIVLSSLSLVTTVFALNSEAAREVMSKSSLPVGLQIAMAYVGLGITLACGIGMLKGQNWARLLYTVWGALGFVVSATTSPITVALIPSVLVFLVIVFFLFRPAANEFFATSGADHATGA